MILALSIHYSRASDLVRPTTCAPTRRAGHGLPRRLRQLVQPPRGAAGRFVLSADAVVQRQRPARRGGARGQQVPVDQLPESTLVYLLGSRYCETDLLSDMAWQRFGNGPTGWARVQAVCDFVHQHIEFGYQHARRTRTAWEAYNEGRACAATTPTWPSRCAAA
jgi:transglutaminase-like putative cysteine protease